jgi:hypothetical protein
MALRNAFANVATEATLDDIRDDQYTSQRELLSQILTQLKILNLHMAKIGDEELTAEDLDLDTEELL